ncbi:MAG TPA: response regulator [Kofleriaceae bacterium]|nr:response regulator [Kofleriaceae bacterium]
MADAANILLVEDDEDLSEVLADLLTDCGYRVATAVHGQEALDYLAEADLLPGLILLDWMMPVMDGEEFIRHKAGIPAIAKVPVFLLSARGDPPASMVALGIQRVFRKPLLFEQLRSAIETVLNR